MSWSAAWLLCALFEVGVMALGFAWHDLAIVIVGALWSAFSIAMSIRSAR